ncbi:DUF3221 domain-containing protein [Ornithinibacillus sp. L9]|uniref:DUF3221 domain-containing protein n=1 Tax=Ornithinibacillus caprae TaxID=2678566 RepID=A0A6N8FKI7_9BACI|nr:DUF3221 domain-containing protein [Ornithinibacillus caprae]MUK88299.1 DUF3221 domain-containing protein [Ornithinibacillus caprae]
MRSILSLFFVIFILMTGCSDGIETETYDNSDGEEVPIPSIEFGISDNKVLSGEVIKKRKKEITLEVSGDSIIGEGTIWVKVDDENMLVDIKKGQKVNVWYDYIRESYPPQTTGLKIEVESK